VCVCVCVSSIFLLMFCHCLDYLLPISVRFTSENNVLSHFFAHSLSSCRNTRQCRHSSVTIPSSSSLSLNSARVNLSLGFTPVLAFLSTLHVLTYHLALHCTIYILLTNLISTLDSPMRAPGL